MKINTAIVAIAIVALVLTGCTSTTPTINDAAITSSATTQVSQSADGTVQVLETVGYNGEHGTRGPKDDSVSTTIALDGNNIITAVTNTYEAGSPKSKQYQASFENAIAGEVIGKSIKDVKITTIGGASNTSVAFNQALDNIRTKLNG